MNQEQIQMHLIVVRFVPDIHLLHFINLTLCKHPVKEIKAFTQQEGFNIFPASFVILGICDEPKNIVIMWLLNMCFYYVS